MKYDMSYILLQYYVQTKRYLGGDFILPLYLICFVYLMITNKSFRTKYGYGLLLIVCAFYVPYLYFPLWHRLFGGITWRFFWILCEAFVCCYAFIDLIVRLKNKALRIVVVLLCLSLIVVSGDFVYQSQKFSKAENPYKLLQTVVDIGDYLLSIDEQPKILVQGKYVSQYRQYSDAIHMLYGRDTTGGSIPIEDARIEQISKEVKNKTIDIVFVTQVCQEYDVKYLVVKKKKNRDEFPKYGWRLIQVIDKYYIYMRG